MINKLLALLLTITVPIWIIPAIFLFICTETLTSAYVDLYNWLEENE